MTIIDHPSVVGHSQPKSNLPQPNVPQSNVLQANVPRQNSTNTNVSAEPARSANSAPGGTSVSIAGALTAALHDSLLADPNVVIFGEDVGPLGGVFRVTDGLHAQFGESRVWDSPLAEAGIVGTAIGMAMYGLRPVVELQFDAFSYPAFEQITSHLAKMHNRTKGRVSLPIVIRIPYAGGIGGVEHHSDSSEAYWTHTPGLTVVTPSNPSDAYAMLREAIASDDPVIFLEPKSRYWSKDLVELPVRTAPMTSAVVVRAGTDVTLLAYGPTVKTALRAAELGELEGLSVEVVDLRSLSPFDDETVGESVRKTGRAAVIHEAAQFGGYGAEVAARVTERQFFHLSAPILRIAGFDIPYPSPKNEEHYLPTAERVLAALDTWEW
jgi:2-oxoisovalerate dehydrogenase E1 component beta subunit